MKAPTYFKTIQQGYLDRKAGLAMQDHKWVKEGLLTDLYVLGYKLAS